MLLAISIETRIDCERDNGRLSGCYVHNVLVNTDHIVDVHPVVARDNQGIRVNAFGDVIYDGFVITLSDGRTITSVGDHKSAFESILCRLK